MGAGKYSERAQDAGRKEPGAPPRAVRRPDLGAGIFEKAGDEAGNGRRCSNLFHRKLLTSERNLNKTCKST